MGSGHASLEHDISYHASDEVGLNKTIQVTSGVQNRTRYILYSTILCSTIFSFVNSQIFDTASHFNRFSVVFGIYFNFSNF